MWTSRSSIHNVSDRMGWFPFWILNEFLFCSLYFVGHSFCSWAGVYLMFIRGLLGPNVCMWLSCDCLVCPLVIISLAVWFLKALLWFGLPTLWYSGDIGTVVENMLGKRGNQLDEDAEGLLREGKIYPVFPQNRSWMKYWTWMQYFNNEPEEEDNLLRDP